jgi:glyoxylase-like metal-dependent hydrolase (beta-lactamase superfamily II)
VASTSPSEVARGVWVVETQVADGKAGVIAGSQVALAVDAGIDDAEGAAVFAAAASLGRDEVALVYTHGHIDHVLGGTAFAGRAIHARREVGEYMRTQLAAWAERNGEPTAQLDARLGWPTHPFDGEAVLDLGGRSVRLIDSPGHAPGAICVFDPGAGVLFGGDTIVTAIPPAFSDGDAATLEQTLRRLATLDAEVLIPGHGDTVSGRVAVREAISWPADYLRRCLDHVDATRGQTTEEVIAAASYDRFIGDRLPRDRFRMEWRHEQTLRVILLRLLSDTVC